MGLDRDQCGPPIATQVPIYPSLDMHNAPQYPSRLRWGAGGYFLINEDIEWMLSLYLERPEQGADWRASPIVAASYTGLPPALVVTASHDPLVDEGKLYAQRLMKDGVEAEYVQFDGTIHGFVGFASFIDSGARALNLICERIRHAVR